MKFAQTLVTLAVALAATAMTACGGGGGGGNKATATAPNNPPTSPGTPPNPPGGPAPMPGTQSLDTAALLAQAKQPSETASPYPVNNGAVTLTDTSEANQPIKLN
jgi:hypothetical protein